MIDDEWKANVEARLTALEQARPGRRAKPIVVRQEGVCGVDPDRDSSICEDASVYRRQRGCLGVACQRISNEYYAQRRSGEAS